MTKKIKTGRKPRPVTKALRELLVELTCLPDEAEKAGAKYAAALPITRAIPSPTRLGGIESGTGNLAQRIATALGDRELARDLGALNVTMTETAAGRRSRRRLAAEERAS